MSPFVLLKVLVQWQSLNPSTKVEHEIIELVKHFPYLKELYDLDVSGKSGCGVKTTAYPNLFHFTLTEHDSKHVHPDTVLNDYLDPLKTNVSDFDFMFLVSQATYLESGIVYDDAKMESAIEKCFPTIESIICGLDACHGLIRIL